MQHIVHDLDAYENLLYTHSQSHGTIQEKQKDIIDKVNVISSRIFDDISRQIFIEENDVVLYKIYDLFIGSTAKLYNKSTAIDSYRGAIDKLFRVLMIKPKTYFLYLPTRVFNQFTKGMTYFANDNPVEHPVYHREASCKSKYINVDAKFSKPNSKDALSTCYIERMIYNKLYTHFLHEQEVRHLKELNLVERYFQKHFPSISINVDIKYDTNLYPYKCIVTTIEECEENKNVKILTITIEIYTKKPWDSEIVMCEKQVVHKGKVANFSKISSFQMATDWNPVNSRRSN